MNHYSTKATLNFIALLSAVICIWLSIQYVYSPEGFGVTASENGWLVYRLAEDGSLWNNDVITRIGEQDYNPSIFIAPFSGYRGGDVVALEVVRGGETVIVDYRLPEDSLVDRVTRMMIFLFWSPFWACGFWICRKALADSRSALMSALFFLYAMWMASGLVSSTFVSSASVIVHAATWVLVPLSIHTHWLFPYPLSGVSRVKVGALYAFFVILGVAEIFRILPRQVFVVGTVIMVAAPLVLLALHTDKTCLYSRRLMFLGVFTLTIPLVAWLVISFVSVLYEPSPAAWVMVGGVALLAIPVYPLLYTYANYRHLLSAKAEKRLWQGSAMAVYICLTLVVVATAISVAGAVQRLATEVVSLSLITGFVVAISASLGVGSAQSWMHRFTFGDFDARIVQAVTAFSAQMTELTEGRMLESSLLALAKTELGIQECAVYLTMPKLELSAASGGAPPQTIAPTSEVLRVLGRYHHEGFPEMPWVRLSVPLLVQQRLVGIWLLGPRQHDGFYSSSHVAQLRSLGNQVAAVVELRRQQREIEKQALVVAAKEKEAALGRVVASIAHQFRNPLQVIMGAIEADNQYEKPDREWLRVAYERAAQLTDVVRSIQRFASDEEVGATGRGDVNKAIEEAALLIARRMKEQGITMEHKGARDLFVAMGPSELTQVVMNLLENASEAQSGGKVVVTSTKQKDEVLITVADEGEGIVDVERIFEPLYTTKHGLGLGLWIARSIIERNRGSIQAGNSEKGAVFTVTLPAI